VGVPGTHINAFEREFKMSLPTAEEIINLYLYGVSEIPTDRTNHNLIGHGESVVSVDVNEYMDDGPVRFVFPHEFLVVQNFFSILGEDLLPGKYDLAVVMEHFDLSSDIVNKQQFYFDDGQDNYAERVLIWNTTKFELFEGAKFIIEEDGTRYI
jgi:hypothetical protein